MGPDRAGHVRERGRGAVVLAAVGDRDAIRVEPGVAGVVRGHHLHRVGALWLGVGVAVVALRGEGCAGCFLYAVYTAWT